MCTAYGKDRFNEAIETPKPKTTHVFAPAMRFCVVVKHPKAVHPSSNRCWMSSFHNRSSCSRIVINISVRLLGEEKKKNTAVIICTGADGWLALG